LGRNCFFAGFGGGHTIRNEFPFYCLIYGTLDFASALNRANQSPNTDSNRSGNSYGGSSDKCGSARNGSGYCGPNALRNRLNGGFFNAA
jgi:uncharacterized membrane protein